MITVTPQGNVYLCKTPLENDYKNQLDFANATAQQNYFNTSSVLKHTCSDFTYIKKDNQIVVDKPIDTIIDCNYLFYRNVGFTTKYYYCFITNMEYVNENATRITFEVDVYQTYMFDIVKKACFVEREHVNDDTIGANTTHEGLDTGDFIINDATFLDDYAISGHVVIGVSKLPEELETTSTNLLNAKQYNGIYSGLYYLVFYTYEDASKFLAIMDVEDRAQDVYSVFLVPFSLYNKTGSWAYFQKTLAVIQQTITVYYEFLPQSTGATRMATQNITINSTLNGYTPKNNKMFTKEFNYMYVTNNNGGNVEMSYEDFNNNSPVFHVIGSVCPGCSIKLIPDDYKKYTTGTVNNDLITYNDNLFDFGLVGGKFPTCSWASDSYTNWLTEQGVNRTLSQIGDVASIGIASAVNPYYALVGGLGLITDALQEKQKRETSPIQAKGNTNSGDVSFSASMTRFTVYQMSCRYEFAKRIDEYLSMFGYKVNEVKIPNLTGRTYWNYVKTIDCNFEGDIPQVYLNKIKEMFNNGVTIWHDSSKFLDYSQNNAIVTPTP